MTNEQRKALTNILKAIEDSENYAVPHDNKPEENTAIATFIRQLFNVEDGEVKDFNDEAVVGWANVQRCPKVRLI